MINQIESERYIRTNTNFGEIVYEDKTIIFNSLHKKNNTVVVGYRFFDDAISTKRECYFNLH